jgi:alpha-tubulin suppressor-like RCC1 family protein
MAKVQGLDNIQISCSDKFCISLDTQNFINIWGSSSIVQEEDFEVPKYSGTVIQLATCKKYILALKSDNTLFGWGDSSKKYFTPPVGLKNVSKIVGCNENFLVLLKNGKVYGFGNKKVFNVMDEMPSSVNLGFPVVDIAIGDFHATILKKDGEIISWQNMSKSRNNFDFPIFDSKPISVKAKKDCTLILTENGKIYGMGSNNSGQIDIPIFNKKVISYDVGDFHCVAITEDKNVYTWGCVFPEDTKGKKYEPELQYFIAVPDDILESKNETPYKAFAGNLCTFILNTNGDVIGWGDKNKKMLRIPEMIPPKIDLSEPNIDLRSFGINSDVDTILSLKNIPEDLINPVIKRTDDFIRTKNNIFYLKNKTLLGSGTFGDVYEAEYKGRTIVFKEVRLFDKSDDEEDEESFAISPSPGKYIQQYLNNVVLETIIQIILQLETRRLNPGFRVCGDIYEVASDFQRNRVLIFQEKLNYDLIDYVRSKKEKLEDKDMANIIIQAAKILDFLGRKYNYNHRDLKYDNIMVKIVNNDPEVLLIDFGFSCMTYRGHRIKVKNYNEDEVCYRETRDLTFLLYRLFSKEDVRKYTSALMQKTIKKILSFNVKGFACDLENQECGAEAFNEPADMYDILNRDYVENKNASPKAVIKAMEKFL